MSFEENKEVVRQLTERTGQGDNSAFDELTTEDFFVHVLFNKGMDIDKNAAKRTNDGGHAK